MLINVILYNLYQFFCELTLPFTKYKTDADNDDVYNNYYIYIIESVDSISRDEPDSPLMQYITNAGLSRARYTITYFKYMYIPPSCSTADFQWNEKH